MLNYSSPFLLFCNCNNIFNEKKEPEKEEDYFSSQSTLNDSRLSQSNYFQNQSLKESQQYFDDDENSVDSQQQINLFIDSKIFKQNPNIINSYIDKITNIKFNDSCDDNNSNDKINKYKDSRFLKKKDSNEKKEKNDNNLQFKGNPMDMSYHY